MVVSECVEGGLCAGKCPEQLVSLVDGRVVVAPGKVVWLYSLIGASALIVRHPPGLVACIVSALALAVTLCAGHSVGLHRGIIHRSYRSSRFLRGALAYLFVHTGIGGPISWIRLHHVRDYYQNVARAPRYFRYEHSALRDFFWNLHLRFVPRDASLYGLPSADERDGWLVFLERTWPAHVVGLFVLLWSCFGLGAAVVCVPVRAAVSVIGHWYIGFQAHKEGGVRYELDGSAEIGRNLPLLGILSFGEGFHNNHHANPSSARMGEDRYELDLGWYLVLALERLGLVWNVQSTERDDGVRRFNARRVSS
jgi:fatty-acid desaturase